MWYRWKDIPKLSQTGPVPSPLYLHLNNDISVKVLKTYYKFSVVWVFRVPARIIWGNFLLYKRF